MQLPGLSIGIIADDLTGACDTALQFFAGHTKTHVLLDFQQFLQEGPSQGVLQENQVWSINTASRHMDPLEAQIRVRHAAALCRDRFGVENFYKKIDSTLRGNIAHECLGLLEELKAQCAVIVPAYPQEGRRTVGGYHLVRGVPVEKTIIARDPLFPVRQSHVPTLLGQSVKPELVGHIALAQVLHGAGPILVKLNEFIREGKKLVVIDATRTEDLEQIALAIEKAQQNARLLPCGSAGLAQALADLWAPEPEESNVTPFRKPLSATPASPILIVSGSNTDITRQQLLRLLENYTYYGQGSRLEIFDLPSDQLLGLAPLEETAARIREALGERNTVVLASALKEEAYQRTLNLAREHRIPEAQAIRQVQETLARLTVDSIRGRTVKLVLAGGETTGEICDCLNIRELEIVAEADESIPLSIDPQGRWIVTKSGGFGSPLALANVIKFIKQRESSSVHV